MNTAFVRRREDDRFLTGRALFSADIAPPGTVHAHFLRSDRAHADILQLDVREASKMPGVLAIFTSADSRQAGYRTPPPLVRYPGKDGVALKVPPHNVFAEKKVRFVGQPIALIIALNSFLAQDAAEKISLSYHELPVVIDAMAAMNSGAPQLYDDVARNICFESLLSGNFASGIAQCAENI